MIELQVAPSGIKDLEEKQEVRHLMGGGPSELTLFLLPLCHQHQPQPKAKMAAAGIKSYIQHERERAQNACLALQFDRVNLDQHHMKQMAVWGSSRGETQE